MYGQLTPCERSKIFRGGMLSANPSVSEAQRHANLQCFRWQPASQAFASNCVYDSQSVENREGKSSGGAKSLEIVHLS